MSPALVKRAEVVQNLAVRGFNRRFYDENFSFLRQTQPSSFPWNNIHWNYGACTTSCQDAVSTYLPSSRLRRKPQDQGTPKGYCFKFHMGVNCDPGCV